MARYAVILAGASQHKVTEGETLKIDLIAGKKKGEKLTFDKVFMVGGEGGPTVGQPHVAGAKVEASILDNGADDQGVKGKKIFVLKRRPGDWTKERGHRQRFTHIKIEKISG